MKPPMNQEVTLMSPTDKKDNYGRPILVPSVSRARVQFSSRVVQGADGQHYETSLEVDLPPEILVKYGTEIHYQDAFGLTKGKVISMNESTNLSGRKVYFRTVYIG